MTTIDSLSVIAPANFVLGPRQGYWTYEDYAKLPDEGQRYEVMDGVLLMAPSPGSAHQNVVMVLSYYLFQSISLKGLGKVFSAPLDVELAAGRVVQPDVFVILNENLHKITVQRVIGAPDMVVEVAFPGTAGYDRLSKSEAYAQAGVKEYWIVDVETRSVEVLLLTAEIYQSQGVFQGKDPLPSRVVPDLSVNVEQFFL